MISRIVFKSSKVRSSLIIVQLCQSPLRSLSTDVMNISTPTTSGKKEEICMTTYKDLHEKSIESTLTESDMEHVLRLIQNDTSTVGTGESEKNIALKVPIMVRDFNLGTSKAEVATLPLFMCTVFRCLNAYTNWHILEPKVPLAPEVSYKDQDVKLRTPMITLPVSPTNTTDRLVITSTTADRLESLMSVFDENMSEGVAINQYPGYELIDRVMQLAEDEGNNTIEPKANICGLMLNPEAGKFTNLSSQNQLAILSFWANSISTDHSIKKMSSLRKHIKHSEIEEMKCLASAAVNQVLNKHGIFWILRPPTEEFQVIQSTDNHALLFTAPDIAMRYYLNASSTNADMSDMRIDVVSCQSLRHQFSQGSNSMLKGVFFNPVSEEDIKVSSSSTETIKNKFSRDECMDCYTLIDDMNEHAK